MYLKNKHVMLAQVKNKYSLKNMLKKYDEVYDCIINKNILAGNENNN